jgi:hypothetical protein
MDEDNTSVMQKCVKCGILADYKVEKLKSRKLVGNSCGLVYLCWQHFNKGLEELANNGKIYGTEIEISKYGDVYLQSDIEKKNRIGEMYQTTYRIKPEGILKKKYNTQCIDSI